MSRLLEVLGVKGKPPSVERDPQTPRTHTIITPASLDEQPMIDSFLAAECIIPDDHPLEFYPEFVSFAQEWNEYAEGRRLAFQQIIHNRTVSLTLTSGTDARLAGLSEKAALTQSRFLGLDEQKLATLSVKEREGKKQYAMERAEAARSRLEAYSAQRDLRRKEAESLLASANHDLRNADREFALGGDDSRVYLFALERIFFPEIPGEAEDGALSEEDVDSSVYADRQSQVDDLFVQFARRKLDTNLYTLNYLFFCFKGSYENGKMVEHDAVNSQAREATKRQRELLRGVYGRRDF